MKIITGLGYDDRLPNHPYELLNSKICGELSLIEELEFRAGLSVHKEDKASRIIAYLNALKKADSPQRFYNASLDTDPLSSAETLLDWRDWALAQGWNPQSGDKSNGRLSDLCDVETHFVCDSLSLAERIFRLIPLAGALKETIDEIILHTEVSQWPVAFQHLFDQLRNVGINTIENIPDISTPLAQEGCDLWKLQKAILDKKFVPIEFTNDGSLRLYHCSSEQIVADFIAHLDHENSFIITQSQNYDIETAIKKQHQVSLGLGSKSMSRIPNHLLQLSILCAWFTPSPEIVLQYLTLPAGKFKTLRRKLARLFRDLPGYDVQEWQKIIDEFVDSEVKRKPELNPSSLRQSIKEWLPISVCHSDENMPVKLAIEIATRISSYWKTLHSIGDEAAKDIYWSSYKAANAVIEALSKWPGYEINKVQLNRLLSIIRRMRPSAYCQAREVATYDLVTNPISIYLTSRDVKHLIWLEPSIPTKDYIPPFSKEELASIPWALTQQKYAISQDLEIKRLCSVFLKARKSVSLIFTSEETELFGLFLKQLMGVRSLSELEPSLLIKSTTEVSLTPIKEQLLPHSKRWLQLGIPIHSRRQKESYSSLSSLVIKPHEYVFKYCANISEGTIEAIAFDNRLKGNLAHRIIEIWFNANPWTGEQVTRAYIENWLNDNLSNFIRQFALPLAQPGKHVERLIFQDTMLNAISKLSDALYHAKVKGVITEAHMETPFNKCNLEGTMDIICEFEGEKFAIIDMKWGGYERYKHELKSNSSLQLATYAYIAQKSQQTQLIEAGYFILSRAELLCNSSIIFPTATVINPEQPGSLNSTWAQLERTIQWRKEQLKQGLIEITYGEAALDELSIPPDGCLALSDAEEKSLKEQSSPYMKNYKKIDVWRNLTGNIKD